MEKYITRFNQMIELRGLANNTAKSYNSYLKKYLKYLKNVLKKTPEEVTWDNVREYILYQKNALNLSNRTINASNAQLKFFFEHVLNKPWERFQIPILRFNTYLPKILTLEEVKYLIDTIPNLKHKAMVSTTASSGLRISETCSLRYDDINRANMSVHVRESKNRSDRYTLLSAKNLEILTQYWYEYGKPREWLFPGQKEGTHINQQSLHYIIKEHTARLGWDKEISCHTFRHCYGTFLYENGTDLNTIKHLMGHKSLSSTMVYLHLSSKAKSGVKNPFDIEV